MDVDVLGGLGLHTVDGVQVGSGDGLVGNNVDGLFLNGEVDGLLVSGGPAGGHNAEVVDGVILNEVVQLVALNSGGNDLVLILGDLQSVGSDDGIDIGVELHLGDNSSQNVVRTGVLELELAVLALLGGVQQAVEGQLASLLTGHGLAQDDALQAVQQVVGSQSGGNGELIAGTGEVAVDASGDHHHLTELVAGDVGGGVELALAAAGDDAQAGAVGDGAGRPAASLNVGEGNGVVGQVVSNLLAQQHVADDLGGLLTGQVAIGLELAVDTIEDTDTAHDGNSFDILDVISIGVGGTGKGHGHDQNQHQSENLLEISHSGFPPFCICPFGTILFV